MRRRIMVSLDLKSSAAEMINAQNYTSSHFVMGCDD
jgi:hypothetical protein